METYETTTTPSIADSLNRMSQENKEYAAFMAGYRAAAKSIDLPLDYVSLDGENIPALDPESDPEFQDLIVKEDCTSSAALRKNWIKGFYSYYTHINQPD